MRSLILRTLEITQETLGHHERLTHIEGGLGSQILGLISFYNSQQKYGISNAKLELSYFDEPRHSNLWPWALSKYGIYIEDLRVYESRKWFNLFKAKRDFLTETELLDSYWSTSRERYLHRFPFDQTALEKFLKEVTGSLELDCYGAVHIRRGDYLQVASRVIGFSEYVNLLRSIRSIIPKTLFVVSDSKLEKNEINELEDLFGESHRLLALDGPNYDFFLIHCLLRRAQFLVTSNSTFSFSAGLLGRDGQVVFSPVEFHSGQDSEKYNRTFRSITRFAAWDLAGGLGKGLK